jgi:dUTP pyrophosphatase
MIVMVVKFKPLTETARIPKYANEYAAGADLFSDENVTLQPGQRTLVTTNVAMEIPKGWEGQVRPRSGFALKCGVTVLNSPGTIDSDWRGPLGALLINHGQDAVVIGKGDRIAQLVIARAPQAHFFEATTLTDTKRGTKGWGSTGR